MAWKRPILALVHLAALQLAACGGAPPSRPAGPTDATAAEATIPAAGTENDQGAELGPIPVSHDDPSWGNANAPVTIVEFADFQCPFSRRVAATLRELRAKYGPDQLRIVWKSYPLPFHPLARGAHEDAQIAFMRGGDKAFWAFYDAVYDSQAPFDAQLYRDADKRAGVTANDLTSLRPKASAKVDADLALANKIGISGTPGFMINGSYLSGAQPADKFIALIDDELPKARALAASGVAPARVYATRAQSNFRHVDKTPAAPVKEPEDDRTVWNVPVGTSPVRGKPTALVTIVEFADYQCPFCGRVEPTLEKIQKQYGDKVRIVYKDEPLPFHPRADPAAQVSREVRARKGDLAFWRFHDALYADQTHLADDDLVAAAQTVGLDKGAVLAVLASKKYSAAIAVDTELGEDVAATGTPHFFLNGRRLVGAQPYEKFAEIVDAELAHASELVKQGTPANKVYEAITKGGKSTPAPEAVTLPAPTSANPSRGPANAKILVHYFADFQCPFCRRAEPTLAELEKAYPGQVRVVWHNHPLPMHQNAKLAAEAAMEAFAQKGSTGFWAMHDILMNEQSALDRQGLDAAAIQVGLDMKRFSLALDNHTHAAAIDAETKLAEGATLSGTPAFVINGYLVSGAQPLAKFKRAVSYARSVKP